MPITTLDASTEDAYKINPELQGNVLTGSNNVF
jgi:hypothetical protein